MKGALKLVAGIALLVIVATLLFWLDVSIASKDYRYGCRRCGQHWHGKALEKAHFTSYTETDSCFFLCESCWKVLSPNLRLIYYKQAFSQHHWSQEKWPLIEKAVREGK